MKRRTAPLLMASLLFSSCSVLSVRSNFELEEGNTDWSLSHQGLADRFGRPAGEDYITVSFDGRELFLLMGPPFVPFIPAFFHGGIDYSNFVLHIGFDDQKRTVDPQQVHFIMNDSIEIRPDHAVKKYSDEHRKSIPTSVSPPYGYIHGNMLFYFRRDLREIDKLTIRFDGNAAGDSAVTIPPLTILRGHKLVYRHAFSY